MEAKDYTNIAGTPFQPYVNDQIEIRKEIVNKETRSQSELLWLTNRNSWIRISSGVDVKDDNPYFLNERGNILSKKYILQAGLVDHTGGNTSYKLRSGIGSNDAYGIGGTDFGYKPMPGLENLSIKTGGRLGTLREATFDFDDPKPLQGISYATATRHLRVLRKRLEKLMGRSAQSAGPPWSDLQRRQWQLLW